MSYKEDPFFFLLSIHLRICLYSHLLPLSPSFHRLFRVIDECVDRRESAVTRSLFLNGFRFRLGGKKYLVAVPKELDALDVNHVF